MNIHPHHTNPDSCAPEVRTKINCAIHTGTECRLSIYISTGCKTMYKSAACTQTRGAHDKPISTPRPPATHPASHCKRGVHTVASPCTAQPHTCQKSKHTRSETPASKQSHDAGSIVQQQSVPARQHHPSKRALKRPSEKQRPARKAGCQTKPPKAAKSICMARMTDGVPEGSHCTTKPRPAGAWPQQAGCTQKGIVCHTAPL